MIAPHVYEKAIAPQVKGILARPQSVAERHLSSIATAKAVAIS